MGCELDGGERAAARLEVMGGEPGTSGASPDAIAAGGGGRTFCETAPEQSRSRDLQIDP
jgi:hypothetical protein